MRLPGCYVMTDDFETLADRWQVQEITPLGANLAMILLKSPSGGIYASVRLNGCNVSASRQGCRCQMGRIKAILGGYYVRTESGVFPHFRVGMPPEVSRLKFHVYF